jgi:hypothetical protein
MPIHIYRNKKRRSSDQTTKPTQQRASVLSLSGSYHNAVFASLPLKKGVIQFFVLPTYEVRSSIIEDQRKD